MIWSLFGHLWWGLPAALAIAGGAAFAIGAWPLVLATLGKLPPKAQALLLALLAAVVAASGLYAVGRAHEARDHAGELSALQERLDAALDANATNLEAIARLTAANTAWAAQAEAKDREAAAAIAALAGERDRLADELERRRQARQRIYDHDQDAAAWARQPVPAVLADRLRE